MRPDEERLVVLLVLDAPHDAVERPQRRDGELELDHAVGQLDVVEGEQEAIAWIRRRHALASEVLGERMRGRPRPALRVERNDFHALQAADLAASNAVERSTRARATSSISISSSGVSDRVRSQTNAITRGRSSIAASSGRA